jgi:hypothetical protein
VEELVGNHISSEDSLERDNDSELKCRSKVPTVKACVHQFNQCNRMLKYNIMCTSICGGTKWIEQNSSAAF